MTTFTHRWVLWIAILALLGCGSRSSSRVCAVGFFPPRTSSRFANAQPIVDILHKELGIGDRPFVAVDYTGVIEALRAKKLDIAFLLGLLCPRRTRPTSRWF